MRKVGERRQRQRASSFTQGHAEEIRGGGKRGTKKSKTQAEQWLELIDNKLQGSTSPHTYAKIDRHAVRRMKDAAEKVVQDGGGFTDCYVFSDGSGLYEKRKDDWYPVDAGVIAEILRSPSVRFAVAGKCDRRQLFFPLNDN